MKKTRFLITTIACAGFTFTACDNKSAKPEEKSPEPGKSADTAKPAAAPKPVAPLAPAADVSKIAGAYGFVAKLPRNVDGFSANYRMHDLWVSLVNSKWAAALLELPPVKSDPGFAKVRDQWNSPEGMQGREVFAQVFGNEYVVAMPAGFAEQMKPWQELLSVYQSTMVQGLFMAGVSGKPASPQKMQEMLRGAAPELATALAKCEIPSLIFVAKAGKIRQLVDQVTKEFVAKIGTELPPAFETEKFKIADKYEFQSVSIAAKKLIAQFEEVKIELQLKELLGSAAAAKEAVAALSTKRAELAWGWVDDYLVVSIGRDHSHVKFATSEADSALANPEVAARATQYLDKKPFGLSYLAKSLFEKLDGGIEFAESFKSVAEELKGILKDDQIAAMVTDVKKIEGRAQGLFKTTYDAQVQIGYWDAGLHLESFGGPRNGMLDASKPLAFSNLMTPSTFMLLDGRTNGKQSKATTDFIEEVAGTAWGWYEKFGRTMVPETERQGAAMVETLAIPMVKSFWQASRKLGAALGDEAAFVFDTAGVVPKIKDVPEFFQQGKIPRLAYVVEMKDRAGVSAAWTGYSTIIKQIAGLAGGAEGGPKIPEPTMKKEGDTEIHFLPLPVETGDLLPHVAISKDRWILSTSPSLSATIATTSANTAGPSLSGDIRLNFTALYDLAGVWLGVLDKNTADIMGPDAKGFQEAKPLIEAGLKLARSIQGLDVKVSEEASQSRVSVHLKLQDAK